MIELEGNDFLKSIKIGVAITKSPTQFGMRTKIFLIPLVSIQCVQYTIQMIMAASTIILGIDPGTRVTGYGVISLNPNPKPLDFGCICPPPKLLLPMRYKIIFESLESLIEKYKPNAIAVESQFVLKNPQSAIKLGMAKGMALLAAARYNIPVYEFAPTKAKLAVVGHGGASKWQVQKMIQAILQLPQLPEPEDAADALALALCCSHNLIPPIKNNAAFQLRENCQKSTIASDIVLD